MRYVYSGPTSGATLEAGADGILEVMFFDGKEVELPEDNEYVKTLVALGHLKPVAGLSKVTAVSKKTKKEVNDVS
jgi:hypothetical protein